MGAKVDGLSPIRRQYLALKRQHPDAILFFRLGDFYETFDSDAEVTSRALQITLTSREMGRGLRVPLAGIPYHAAETYIARLIAAGHKVAVCEQMGPSDVGVPARASTAASQRSKPLPGIDIGVDVAKPGEAATEGPAGRARTGRSIPRPASFMGRDAAGLGGAVPAKGMMAREIVRVVTPGTVVEPRMLQAHRNNYLCALVAGFEADGRPRYGLALADLTTGEFAVTELSGEEAAAELARELDRLQPAECLVPGTRPSDPGSFRGATPGGAPENRSDPEQAARLAGMESTAGTAGKGSTASTASTAAGVRTAGRWHSSGTSPTGEAHPSPEVQACAGRNITWVDPWRFELAAAQGTLCRLFGVASLAGYGCAHLPLAIRAAGALVAYVEQTHRQLLSLLDGIHSYQPGAFMRLDGFTRRNLELVEQRPASDAGGPRPTLFGVLDQTLTAMGGRLLRRWVGQPLLDLPSLRERHDVVGALVADGLLRGRLRALLGGVADIERLTNRVRQTSAHPRDLLALRASLQAATELMTLLPVSPNTGRSESGLPDAGSFGTRLPESGSPESEPGSLASEAPEARSPQAGASEPDCLTARLGQIDPCTAVSALIERAVYDRSQDDVRRAAIASWDDERLIQPGYSQELDDLVSSSTDARQWIAGLETAERERTGIKGLRVGFNRVFGYYLHVSHAYRGEVPGHYIRRQTLTDGERYITPELKEYENLVLHAQERIVELESQLFVGVQREIAAHAARLLGTAAALAELDVLASLAEVAIRRSYVRPELDDSHTIEIIGGRHPVVEAALDAATVDAGQPAAFVPNDCRLAADGEQIVILTGPNMAGKSTYLRSVALIVLLAQCGSFVPATAARIGLIDRCFTRVGAQDDLAAGQSTFMVEMVETASILRHATSRSLVILDEIGRGTSTFDGVAIAQAVVEYLHQATSGLDETGTETLTEAGPRTLFATHYHELADLEGVLPRVRNYRMDVLEDGDRVVFLHRVVAGSAGRSYGIHVARLAGVPRAVTQRAEQVLAALEATRHVPAGEHGIAANAFDAAGGGDHGLTVNAHTGGASNLGGGNGAPLMPPGMVAYGPPAQATSIVPGVPNDQTGSETGIDQNGPDGYGSGGGSGPGRARSGRRAAAAAGTAGSSSLQDGMAADLGAIQLSLFAPAHPVVDELRQLDVLSLTPLEALNRLARLVEQVRGSG